jgi:hypothetical protein
MTMNKEENRGHRYNFKVSKPQDIDINRIISEASPGTQIILVESGHSEDAYLLVKKSWLRKLDNDCLHLAGERTHSEWGYTYTNIKDDDFDAIILDSGVKEEGVVELNKEWRVRWVTKHELEELPAQLAAARAIIKKINVRVTYL